MSQTWSGRGVAIARAYIAAQLPADCGQCGKTVETTDQFNVGHIEPRWKRPDLTWTPSNWQPEHRRCSNRTGQREVVEKAKHEARMEMNSNSQINSHSSSDSSATDGRLSAPPLPFSLPSEPSADLYWSDATLSRHEWLRDLLPIPSNANPPLFMSPVPADAVGSYGNDACEWIEHTQGIRLRWWQRLAIIRQLEFRADGSLCHREIVESAPRRSGKSVRIRGLVLWRMAHPEIFGEVQTVIHCGNDLPICREIQRGAWRWAEASNWYVTRANGKECIESPTGDRWLVRAQSGVYGYDACMGVVDESWDVDPTVVSEGLEPATLERLSPQLHLTSTAHRRATSLMRGRLVAGLTTAPTGVLVLIWGSPTGAHPGSPETWRQASPHWTAEREKYVRVKYEAAAAGQLDPSADDPDPMAGFLAQYLNVWDLSGSRAVARGNGITTAEDWADLEEPPPLDVPDSAALESWDTGYSLALAWSGGIVSVSDHGSIDSVVTALREAEYSGTLHVGASLAEHPSLKGIRVKSQSGRTIQSVTALQRLMTDGAIRHDGGEHLTSQVLSLRVTPGADGPRIASNGRADAVKAAIWAIESLRSKVGKPRILLPRLVAA